MLCDMFGHFEGMIYLIVYAGVMGIFDFECGEDNYILYNRGDCEYMLWMF